MSLLRPRDRRTESKVIGSAWFVLVYAWLPRITREAVVRSDLPSSVCLRHEKLTMCTHNWGIRTANISCAWLSSETLRSALRYFKPRFCFFVADCLAAVSFLVPRDSVDLRLRRSLTISKYTACRRPQLLQEETIAYVIDFSSRTLYNVSRCQKTSICEFTLLACSPVPSNAQGFLPGWRMHQL